MRLRRALGNEDRPHAQETLLMRKLPGAAGLAWKEMEPKEPLRGAGKGAMSLVRRINKHLVDDGDEAAKRPDSVVNTPIEDLPLGTDDLGFAGWEAREEAARQQVDALEQAAKLSPQQWAVWKRRRARLSREEIAEELEISRDQVYVQLHNATKKLREARKAAGF